MNINLVGTIPVKPYLLKFVRHYENIEGGEALDLQNNSVVSYTMSLFFTNKTNIDHEDQQSYLTLKKKYSAKLTFKISSRMKNFGKYFISRKTIVVLNKWLERLFHETLLQRILQGALEGKDEKQVIYDFLKELAIEEDVTFDQIKKANYRLRISKNYPDIHQQKRPGGQNPYRSTA